MIRFELCSTEVNPNKNFISKLMENGVIIERELSFWLMFPVYKIYRGNSVIGIISFMQDTENGEGILYIHCLELYKKYNEEPMTRYKLTTDVLTELFHLNICGGIKKKLKGYTYGSDLEMWQMMGAMFSNSPLSGARYTKDRDAILRKRGANDIGLIFKLGYEDFKDRGVR